MSASPTTSAVPDDLREMAKAVAHQARYALHADATDIIAAALLQVRNAEREACARLVANDKRLQGLAGAAIAAAIRARA